MTDRETRFLQKQRNVGRVARVLRGWSAYQGPDDPWYKRTLRMMANHGKLCSCWMCGNPRKHFGERTLQERRADQE